MNQKIESIYNQLDNLIDKEKLDYFESNLKHFELLNKLDK